MTWWTVLKQVPWTEVAVAAPGVVRTAKELLRKTRATPPPAAVTDKLPVDLEGLAQLSTSLGHRIDTLEQEQYSAAALLESLAQQHARTTQAIAALEMRSRILTVICMVLLVTVIALGAVVLKR